VASKTSQNKWASPQGEDYLQLLGPDGALLSGIDSTGSAYGALAPTPAPPSGSFNVKSYGATGNAREFTDGASSGSNTLTSATANFTQADVGKIIWGVEAASGLARVAQGTVQTVVNATKIFVNSPSFQDGYSNLFCVIGTDDTAALIAAYQAACESRTGDDPNSFGNLPAVYVPTGGYIFQSLPFYPNAALQLPNPSIIGDGPASTTFYPSPNYSFTAPFVVGYGMLNLNIGTGTAIGNEIGGFTVNGSGFGFNVGSSFVVDASHAAYVHDITIQNFAGSQIGGIGAPEGAAGFWKNLFSDGNNASGFGIYINGGTCTLINCRGSNGYAGILIANVNEGTSYIDEGDQVTLIGCDNDEGGSVPQVQFQNSSNCSVFGGTLWGGGSPSGSSLPCSVDATSDVSFFGTAIGPFSYRDNTGGITVAAGGIARFAGCRVHSTGSGTALMNDGLVIDLGGNTFDSIAGTGIGPITSIARLAADPSGFTSDQAGYMWINTATSLLKFWNGTVIKTVATV
jgi:hypothetical protein